MTCPAGYVFSACSDVMHRDASCDEACNAVEHGKPVENSEWVLTKVDENWKVVENTLNGGSSSSSSNVGPNVACMWKCKNGYKKQDLSEGLSICVPDTS